MGRKVSVKLEADVAGFITPVQTAKKAADELGDKVSKLDRELDKIPPDAARAAAAMKLLGGEADAAGQKLGDIGTKSTKLSILDARLRESRAEVRKLADEFQRTGDVDVFKKLGDAQGRLAALTKVRRSVADSIEFGVEDGLKSAGSSPSLGPIGAGIGAALAVPLVAAIGGALIGATGFGVAGVGIAGAILGDPAKFQGAWTRVLNNLEGQFINATRPLTDDTLAALTTIGPMVASWHLNDIFDDAQKFVAPLVTGVEGFATGIMHGVADLVDKGAPAVDALSSSMVRLGVASGYAMSEIANGAEGGAMALSDVSKGVGYVIVGFGGIVEAAEKAYQFVHDHPVMSAITTAGMSIPLSVWSNIDDTKKKLTLTELGLRQAAEAAGHAFSQQGDDLTVLQSKLSATTLSSDNLAASMTGKIFNALMGIDQAILGVAESHTRLQESLEASTKAHIKLSDAFDLNSKYGQANRESVLSSVTANMQLYQSQIAAGMSAQDATAAYNDNTASLERQMRNAGLTKDQIDGLIGKYRNVPNTVNTTIAIEGLTTAIANLDHTLRLMAGIKDKDVYVNVHTRQFTTVYNDTTGERRTGNSQNPGGDNKLYGGVRYHAAEGMIVPPSSPGTVLFGEPATGGELYLPLKGISQSRAMSLAQVAGNNYGFSVSANHGRAEPRAFTFAFVGSGSSYTRLLAQTLHEMQRNGQLQLSAS